MLAARDWRSLGRIAVALLALAFGLLTLARARHDPGGSFAGASTLGAIAELAAGWSLVAAGLLFSERHPRNVFGPLTVAAGFAWFLPEWGNNPGIGTAVGFTVGLVGFVACAPLVAHAALTYPTGRLPSRAAAVVLAAAYAGALLLLGLLPTTVFDTKSSGCLQCPRNLALVHGDGRVYDTFNRYGLRLGIAWLAALGALLAWRLIRSSAAAVVVAPVVAPALAYLGFVAWDFQHSLGRNLLSNDAFDVRAWRYEAAALVALAVGVAWGLVRERRLRGSVAQLVVELGRSPQPGAVRDALADALGDPTLELAYRRPHEEQYVDASGLPITVEEGAGRAVTPLLRGNTPVAVLVHDARLLDAPGRVEEVVAAARLAVENERLQAEVLAQVEDLRASRARIVETGDTERRRLERDLHDGAQQRLVALSFGLGLLRSQLGADGDPEELVRIEAAEEKLRQALAELRELAHGIYPAVLGDEGLGAALEALAEQIEIPVRLDGIVDGRFPTPVENAGYFAVVEAIKGAAAANISVEHSDSRLLIRVRTERDGEDPGSSGRLLEISDRVGALDGRVTADGPEIRAEIPCS